MRRADDPRLWFDKADGKTIYGVFTDQRFYSSEYVGPDDEKAAVRFCMDVLETYSEWCKANYLGIRAGQPQLPLPADLINLHMLVVEATQPEEPAVEIPMPDVEEDAYGEPAAQSDEEEG